MKRTVRILFFSLVLVLTVRSTAEIVNFRANTVKYKLSSPRQITCLGNAVISNKQNFMAAEKIVIGGADLDEAKFYYNVLIKNFESGLKLRSQYIEFYQKKDYIRALKNPVLTMGNLVIRCEVMERFLDKELSVIQGQSVITRSNVTIFCKTGLYDEKNKTVDLQGAPRVFIRHPGNDQLVDRFDCGQIVLYNTNNTVVLSREVKGRIYLNE